MLVTTLARKLIRPPRTLLAIALDITLNGVKWERVLADPAQQAEEPPVEAEQPEPEPEPEPEPVAVPETRAEAMLREARHWNEVESRIREGDRVFWYSHPRVAKHIRDKALIDGLEWRDWVKRRFGGPVGAALELGCGSGNDLVEFVRAGYAQTGVGIDLDESRFALQAARNHPGVSFVAADLEEADLGENRYDLIYAHQSFHHFERVEEIMVRIARALKPNGVAVLDEYVGPRRFQWTDLQLDLIEHTLALIPEELRRLPDGRLKTKERRPTPEQVAEVCPSEAIRCDEIVQAFRASFDVIAERGLGGPIQHMLYSEIIQNFPDNEPDVDRLVDSIDAIETTLIGRGYLQHDFMLLVGAKAKG